MSNRRSFALISLLTLILVGSSSFADDRTADQWVDCWAVAIGGRDRLARIVVLDRTGTFESGGFEGTFRVVHTALGWSRSEVTAGTFASTEALKGGSGWSQMGTAPAHDLADTDLERVISDAYMESFSMFFDDRMSGKIRIGANDGSGPPILEVVPDGGHLISVRLDPETCLPVSFETPDRDRKTTTTILSWMDIGGVRFAKDVRQSRGEAKFDDLIHYERVSFPASVDDSLFTPPSTDSSVAADGRITTVPIELTQNHIYVPVVVNGTEESMFILDTGADFTVIEKGHAERLELPMEGAFEVRGAGEASLEASIVREPGLRIGDLEIPSDYMVAVPLGPLSLREGRPIQGILGYDVLSRFVVEIDYEARAIHLHDPAGFEKPADAESFKIRFDGNTPVLDGILALPDGRVIETRLAIDTGNRSALILHAPFVESNDIRSALNETLDAPLGMGVGGATSQDFTRVKSLQLGGFAIESPLASLSKDAQGANANPDIDGNLGGEILRQFTLWVDYQNSQILLRPNDHFGDSIEYDMGGMLFAAEDHSFSSFVVHSVLEGSPAAAAGLREGDRIISVDDQPASELTIDDLTAAFRIDGKRIRIIVERGGRTVSAEVVARRMI